MIIMNFILKILITLSIMLLISCRTTSPQEKIIYPAEDNLSAWWAVLHDPELNSLLEKALNNNNQILSAQANILKTQAELKAAYNAWLPTVNASANSFWLKGWDTHSTPQGAFVQNQALGSINNFKINANYAGFVPNYSVNLLENINNTRLARSSLTMQKAQYMSVRLSVISQTVGAYFSLLGQKEQLKAQWKLIEHLKQLRHLEHVRYKDGASDYSTLANIDQEIATNKAAIASIESSIAHGHNALQLLTNQPLVPIANHKSFYSSSSQQLIPAHLPATILSKRPDIIIAKEQFISSDAHLGLAYAQFFPQISLTGLLGGSSVELIHLLKLTTGLGVAQIAAVMPIINGTLYQQIQASKAGVKAAYFNYLHTLRRALADVDDSLTKSKKSSEAYHNYLVAYKASARAYRIVFARYSSGMQDRRVVLNAQLSLDQAKINRILAKIEELNSTVEAYQALAGG